MAMSYIVREGIWIQNFLNKLLPKQIVRKMEMLGDNEMSLMLIKDCESLNHTKHIDIMYYHI